MTALNGGLSGSLPPSLAATRAALHRVAEHVLAPGLYAATGHIGLLPAPDGFRTPSFGTDDRILAVEGAELVVASAGRGRRARLTTLRAAARFAGVTPGAPVNVYTPATPLELDEPLDIDPGATRVLAGWYLQGAEAMSRFAREIAGDNPSAARLWPEHFDLGITAGRINYGASPGDDHIACPYVYVGPHDGPPPGDAAYWNVPFGAARTIHQIRDADDVIEFFRAGRARILAHATARSTRRTQ